MTSKTTAGSGVPVEIRAARVEDGERLRQITIAAKSHWGYDPRQVSKWAETLDFSATRLHAHELRVASVDGRLVAWVGLIPPVEGVAVLDDLWVEPEWIGKGIGSRLFWAAQRCASELGARLMEWEAEPNAVGFYTKMGGRFLRDTISEWGRPLTVMGVDVTGSTFEHGVGFVAT